MAMDVGPGYEDRLAPADPFEDFTHLADQSARGTFMQAPTKGVSVQPVMIDSNGNVNHMDGTFTDNTGNPIMPTQFDFASATFQFAAAPAGSGEFSAGSPGGQGTVSGPSTSPAAAPSTTSKIANLLGETGAAIGKAGTAAGNNALDQEKLALDANAQNITGQSAFENELLNRAKEETSQRGIDLRNEFIASNMDNAPVSPFDPVGRPTYSPQYRSTVQTLANQGSAALSKPPQYATGSFPQLQPYTPIPPANVQGATNTKPGAISTVANWLAPTATIGKSILDLFK